uniref:Ig-like domain-containing protein n=1 Tax=Pygocentrus nattereri TaxID=42514 RepID=A0A3B4EIG3_PYGNA
LIYSLMFITVGVLGQTVEQPDLSFTKGEGRRAYISCKVNGLLSDNYVHWYQQKEGEALTRILYVNKGASSTVYNPDLLDAKGFSVKLGNNDDYVLRIDAVKLSHEGVYYCACWDTSSHSETNCSHPLQ